MQPTRATLELARLEAQVHALGLGTPHRPAAALRLTPQRPSLLVADNARLAGRTTVPIFILVPHVPLQKRLDIEAPAAMWARRLPGLVGRAWVTAQF